MNGKKVKPIMKEGTKYLFNYKNLRPVSNLHFPSKITERAVFDQVCSHINSNNLFPALQSAYGKFHSTETSMIKQHVSLLVILDLSAAFDTVDHIALLHRLETTYGITGYALQWISSYLHNRYQLVAIKPDGLSEKQHLPFGLPQGSCLGPLLFSIYASKLSNIIQNHLPHLHGYADDTETWYAMERCVRAVRAWMITDKRKLNESKTEFMIIGTRQQLSEINRNTLLVGSDRVESVTEARNLDVLFDCNFNFCNHITKTSSLAFYSLHNIRRITLWPPKYSYQ